ncbi:MAG: Gfo/Idh/MocA family oxidoreductase, partial [Bacteroidota bacterium]
MIIVDTALEKLASENKSIKVAMIGAGFMGRGVALQISQYTKGIELVAISNRNIEKAKQAWTEAGIEDFVSVDSQQAAEEAIHSGKAVISEDPFILCRAGNVDVIVDVTGAVEFGTRLAMECINNGKHIVSMNVEVDATIGPILKTYADKAGIVMTIADGDQPGVQMNLYRFVKGLGVNPVLCGNIKGLHDPYRNPTTQEAFAKKWGQNPSMVTS